MSINPSGKLAKLQNRKCPSCKGPLGDIKGWGVCEVCKTKSCAICGRISIHGARLTPAGKPLCPRHWSAFIRMQTDLVNPRWTADQELKKWIDEFRSLTHSHMEKQLDIPDEAISNAAESIPEEMRQELIDSLTDEQREFIKSLKGNG